MGDKGADANRKIAEIAARQHGVVSIRQLAAAGLTRDAAAKRARASRFHRVHRGVYAVGHRAISLEGRWMAAVLACGPGAVLSHRSAANLWRLLPAQDEPIEVSVRTNGGRKRRPGIRIHRTLTLSPTGWCIGRSAIPVTTPARTIADLRRVAAPAELRRAIRQAEVFGMQTGLEQSTAPTRSELEDRFLALCRRQRLPRPEVNVRVGPYEVDFLWREQGLIVETDGYRFHRGSQAFEDDHERNLGLRAHGWDVLRFTYRQVSENPGRVAAVIRRELQRRPATRAARRARRPVLPRGRPAGRGRAERPPGTSED
jgi:very-short-patch-repair endonuclease